MNWRQFGNRAVIWLLHSPARLLLSASTLALTVTGRRSGAVYTIPVNYVMRGREALVISPRTHIWWKNLIEGAPVTAYLQGQCVRFVGFAITEPDVVADGLLKFLRRSSRYQRSLAVPLDERGAPQRWEDLIRVASHYALICLTPIETVTEALTGEEARHGASVHT